MPYLNKKDRKRLVKPDVDLFPTVEKIIHREVERERTATREAVISAVHNQARATSRENDRARWAFDQGRRWQQRAIRAERALSTAKAEALEAAVRDESLRLSGHSGVSIRGLLRQAKAYRGEA